MITPQLEVGSSLQAPAVQICWLVQVLQGLPPVPQAVELSPERHWLPLQHPEQLPGPHLLLSTQIPWVQVSVDLQVWQAWPPWPQ
jgi:hypothetical protein